MFFSPQAKETEDDLFNYKVELNKLLDIMRHGPMGVILGLRRVGKTSLLKVAYNKFKGPKAWLDGLVVRDETHMWEVLNLKIKQILLNASLKYKFKNLIRNIEIEHVKIKWIDENLEDVIRKEHVKGVLIIDEIQLLKKYGIDKWLAYIYDHLPLRVIISGSQIGIVEKMIGETKEGMKPLKGRLIRRIELKPLNFQKAQVFLIQGMEQINKRISEVEIQEVYSALGGFMGWLTYYGYYRQFYDHEYALNMVKKKAADITSDELLNLLYYTDKTYLMVLDAISNGYKNWKSIKNFLSIQHSLKLSDSSLKRRLDRLIDMSFIIKKHMVYQLSDPLLKQGLKYFFNFQN